ncbi:MAG TPA: S-layer homology domain-containing protein, partial [Firmicutes bacterium]|nr:S-layer homology domain-containing protein [Bacillota bacterium]
ATPSAFGDVPAWAVPYVNAAAARERGWLQGVAPGCFAPDEPVTGAQVAAVLLRASGRGSTVPVTNPWYAGYVAAAREAGLLWEGFDPLAPATRGACAQALAALLP